MEQPVRRSLTIATPCQPIVGIVRDKGTVKPLAGAVIRSYGAWVRSSITPFRFKPGLTETLTYLSALTDKEGRHFTMNRY